MRQQRRQVVEFVPDTRTLQIFVMRVNRESRAFTVALLRIFVVNPQGQLATRQPHTCVVVIDVVRREPVREQVRRTVDGREGWIN